MKRINYADNDDFLRGGLDDVVTILNRFALNSSDIVPLNTSRLTEADMKTVISRMPQYPYIVSKWQSVVGANGRRIVVADDESNSDRTRARKKALQRSTYNLLYSKLKVRELQMQVVDKIAGEGCAVIRFTRDMQPVVDSRFRYNWYWNEAEKRLRLAYIDPKTGAEYKGLTNLTHGEEVYIIRHPSYQSWVLPLSPVETILLIAKLEFHATVANQKIFDQGMIGQIFLKLQKELLPDVRKSLAEDKDDKPSWFTTLMRQINDKLRGSRKANQVSFMPGLEDILEVGKDNKSMQFFELLKDLTPERIAWNWLLTPVDFGTGGATTYNNASVFDDALYDKLGQHIERSLDEMTNEWLLPALGIRTSESYYVEYISPEDPKKLEQLKEAREDVKARLMTPNEYREMKGLPPIEGGDTIAELPAPQPQFNVVDADIVQPRRLDSGGFFR